MQTCLKYQGSHNSHLMNPSFVIYYSQENPQNPDFDLPQTKQSFELKSTIKILISSLKVPVKTQTIFKRLTYLHYNRIMDRNSKTQRLKFYLDVLLNSSHCHKSKPLALSHSTHSVFNKPPVQNH